MESIDKDQSQPQHLSPWAYVIISAIFLLVSILLLLLFIYKAPILLESGIKESFFYFLLIPLGLSSAAFIFGGMKSYAGFKGKVLSGTLELGGPAVVAVMVVVGGFYLVPHVSTFSVTVRVCDENDQPIKSGNITLYFGQDTRISPIASNGEANFKEIPFKFKNESSKFSIDIEGYQLFDPKKKYPLSNSVIDLVLRKKKYCIESIYAIIADHNPFETNINTVLASLANELKAGYPDLPLFIKFTDYMLKKGLDKIEFEIYRNNKAEQSLCEILYDIERIFNSSQKENLISIYLSCDTILVAGSQENIKKGGFNPCVPG